MAKCKGGINIPEIDENTNTQMGFMKVKINVEIPFEDHDDHVIFKNVKIAAEGVMNRGFRSKEETEKMIPFANGAVILLDHPPLTMSQMAALDLEDPDFPAMGMIMNPQGNEMDGILRLQADLKIFKKNRIGDDMMPTINGLSDGTLKNLSIGYFFLATSQEGTFNGEEFDHIEENIRVTHLAILRKDQPACGPPHCGMGVAAATNCDRRISNGGTCPCNHTHQSQGGSEMVNDPANPPEGGQAQRPPAVPMTNETQVSVAELDIDAIAAVNVKIKALVDKNNDLEEKNKKLEDDKKKGDEALTELEAQKTKELEDKTKAIVEVYGDKTKDYLGEEPTSDIIESHFKMIEDLKAKQEEDAPPAAGEASQQTGTSPILQVPGENVNAPPTNEGLSIGDPCVIAPYTPITKENYS